MFLSTDTVSLIELDEIYLAVSQADTLMIGQSSEVISSDAKDNSLGGFEYAGANLPVYCLNNKLRPIQDSAMLGSNQFCLGLKTSQESDYFLLLCKQFQQIDLSQETSSMQELPRFMCNEKMLVEGMLEYQNQVYLITSPDKILDYIVSNDTDQKQGESNA